MIVKTCTSATVSIYCTGDKARLYAAVQETIDAIGLCVSIFPCDYLFTGGQESGYEIRLINYPRLPFDMDTMMAKAGHVAQAVFTVNPKGSLTIVAPHETIFWSNRDSDYD